MAIRPQSTSDLVAAQSAARVVPQQGVNLNSASPLGLISQSLSGATNALTAPSQREAEQANLERANAIRLEQQGFDRAQTDVANTRADARLQLAKDDSARNAANQQLRTDILKTQSDQQSADRAFQIKQGNEKIRLQGELSGIETEKATELSEKKLTPNNPEFKVAEEIAAYEETVKSYPEGYNPVDDIVTSRTAELDLSEGDVSKLRRDMNDVVKSAKDKTGKAWDKELANLATANVLSQANVGTGWFSIDGDLKDESGLSDAIKTEMKRLNNGKAFKLDYDKVNTKYSNQSNAATLRSQQTGIR